MMISLSHQRTDTFALVASRKELYHVDAVGERTDFGSKTDLDIILP